MGLREINATRTRRHIADAALHLFAERGYEATTMEDVAAAADVGISTLYRYFPTKEQLGTAFLGDPGLMADALGERPDDEDPQVSLGHAVLAFIDHVESGPGRPEQYLELLDAGGRLHARLLEWLVEAHERLAGALAERRGLPPEDLGASASSWLAIYALIRLRELGAAGDERPAREVVVEILQALSSAPLLPPAPPG